MANYEQLKQAVSDVIKTNGNEEITGEVMQNVLKTIISAIGANATFVGEATTATAPGTPDGVVVYLAKTPGVYPNFNGIRVVPGELAFLFFKTSWLKISFPNIYGMIKEVTGDIYTLKNGYVDKNGIEKTGHASYKATGFLKIESDLYISEAYEGNEASGLNGSAAAVFFDESKNFVSYYSAPIKGETNYDITILKSSLPPNVVYMRTTCLTVSSPIITGINGIYNEIQKIKNDIIPYKVVSDDYLNLKINATQLELGGIHTGTGQNADNNIRIRFTDALPITTGSYTIIPKEGYYVSRIFRYKDGVFVDVIADNENVTINESVANGIRVVFAKTNPSEIITNNDLNNFTFSITNYPFNKFDEMLKLIQDGTESWFFQKLYSAIGTSITAGFIPRNYPNYPGILDSYAKQAAGILGLNFANNGVSGSTVGKLESNPTANAPFVDRVNSININSKVISVEGGTNDLRKISILGEMDDRTEYTFYGALHLTFQRILQRFVYDQGTEIGKDILIFGITPLKIYPDNTYNGFKMWQYAEAMKKVCEFYSLPCFDAYNLSGLTPSEFRTLQGTEPGYTDLYNPYVTDGVHPTTEGNKIFGTRLAGFMKTLVN